MNGQKKKRALILGVNGQDGSYLAEVLLEKGYEVHGMLRRSATGNTVNIDHLLRDTNVFGQTFFTHKGDLADTTSLYRVIKEADPEEIYNEADQDHVAWSFATPDYSYDITGAAVGRILEIIRQINPKIKYFQPCTSNMFGKADGMSQNEMIPFRPQSPYACAKILAYYLVKHYREAYGIFASVGIFYNHESPRRTDDYVTRKITKSVARISAGLQDKLILGNIDGKIDWGYAGDYMEAAWNILQQPAADDFVIGTGELHSVREFIEEAFRLAGLEMTDRLVFDQSLVRPATNSALAADIGKAQKTFGFNPKVHFKDLVRLMLEADMKAVGKSLK